MMAPDRLRRMVGLLRVLIALGAASPAGDSGCFLRQSMYVSNAFVRRCLASASAQLPVMRRSYSGIAAWHLHQDRGCCICAARTDCRSFFEGGEET